MSVPSNQFNHTCMAHLVTMALKEKKKKIIHKMNNDVDDDRPSFT